MLWITEPLDSGTHPKLIVKMDESKSDVSALVKLISTHARYDGTFELRVAGVYAIRVSRPNTELSHVIQRASVCIVAQGEKAVMVGEEPSCIARPDERYQAGLTAESSPWLLKLAFAGEIDIIALSPYDAGRTARLQTGFRRRRSP